MLGDGDDDVLGHPERDARPDRAGRAVDGRTQRGDQPLALRDRRRRKRSLNDQDLGPSVLGDHLVRSGGRVGFIQSPAQPLDGPVFVAPFLGDVPFVVQRDVKRVGGQLRATDPRRQDVSRRLQVRQRREQKAMVGEVATRGAVVDHHVRHQRRIDLADSGGQQLRPLFAQGGAIAGHRAEDQPQRGRSTLELLEIADGTLVRRQQIRPIGAQRECQRQRQPGGGEQAGAPENSAPPTLQRRGIPIEANVEAKLGTAHQDARQR